MRNSLVKIEEFHLQYVLDGTTITLGYKRIFNEGGKILKSPTYSPPDLGAILGQIVDIEA